MSQKRILTLLFNLEKKIGTGKEEPEMSKFSADGKYSGDRQGDKRKHGQLVGVAAGSCHSPCGPWKWAFWVERVSPINSFDTSSVPTTGLLASYFVPNSRILHRTRGLKAYVFYYLRQKQLSNSSNISKWQLNWYNSNLLLRNFHNTLVFILTTVMSWIHNLAQ